MHVATVQLTIMLIKDKRSSIKLKVSLHCITFFIFYRVLFTFVNCICTLSQSQLLFLLSQLQYHFISFLSRNEGTCYIDFPYFSIQPCTPIYF